MKLTGFKLNFRDLYRTECLLDLSPDGMYIDYISNRHTGRVKIDEEDFINDLMMCNISSWKAAYTSDTPTMLYFPSSKWLIDISFDDSHICSEGEDRFPKEWDMFIQILKTKWHIPINTGSIKKIKKSRQEKDYIVDDAYHEECLQFLRNLSDEEYERYMLDSKNEEARK